MKRTLVVAIDAVLAAVVATGCATRYPPAPRITPVLEVRHGGIRPDGYYELGRFLQAQQRLDDAVVAYRKALALEPKHVEARNGLGTVFALQGRYAEAHAEFEAALAHAPGEAAVLNNIGYTLLLENRRQEALAPLARAAQLEPDNARYRANLAIASDHQSPGPAVPSVAAAPGPFDAVPALRQPDAAPLARASDAAAPARLVAIGPNAFELVEPLARTLARVAPALPASHRRVSLEVSNGHGATGMARHVGRQLARAGLPVARLTNQVPYGALATQVQYRPGHEQAALDLSWRLPGHPPIVASLALRAGIDVRLVLGRELPRDVALGSPGGQLARYRAAD